MSDLTIEKLVAVQRQVQSLAPAYGIPEIRESDMALQRSQAKTYPKRRAKSASHLRRMNKKWLKRYGYKYAPGAFLMDTSALSLGFGDGAPYGRQILFVHPSLMKEVRRTFKEVESATLLKSFAWGV